MAANLKQRLIKAGRDFNFSEGVKVLADPTGAGIDAGQIVTYSGYQGPFLKAVVASNGGATTRRGRLLIAKHDIPAGGYGVCLPWKLVTGVDTSGKALGDKVYLTTAGAVVFADPGAGNRRVVGSVVHVDDATGTGTGQAGAFLFSGEYTGSED